MLAAAMNPCPCGYFGDPQHNCVCGPLGVERYLARVSGPLLDRIDIHLEVDVDPVEQRTRDAGEIALDTERPADAIVLGIAEVAAGTGIHRRGEHEASEIGRASCRERV